MPESMYPANSVQRKIFPTCSGFIVTKWEPAKKFREEEEIEDESGILSNIVGVDDTDEVDVEMVVKPNTNVPTPLSNITFANGNSGNGIYLIRGDVKIIGNAGRAKRIAFKAMKNANLP